MAESELSFAQLLHEQARRNADAAAIVHEQSALTYAARARQCDAAAARLAHEWGIAPGDRVAWLGLNDPVQVVLLFALARLGAVLLPLNFRLAPTKWDAQLAQSTPRLVVHDAAWVEAARALAQRHASAAHDSAEVIAATARASVPDAGDPY